MIDTHVHLNHTDYAKDREAVVSRAREAGVTGMVNIGFDIESSRETVALAEKYSVMYGAVGVHPHDAKTYSDEVETELAAMLEKPDIVAVGEIGLDFYRDLSPRDVQKTVFKRQLDLAARTGAPVIIHCRDAFKDVLGILAEKGEKYDGIFHAFSGDTAMAKDVLSLGFHIGIGGVVTYKNSNLRDVVSELPPGAVVLETDCPYLTPVPFRGKRNEPAYLSFVVEAVAEATGQQIDTVVDVTSENFVRALRL
jgi:TatD DNase family protein